MCWYFPLRSKPFSNALNRELYSKNQSGVLDEEGRLWSIWHARDFFTERKFIKHQAPILV